MPKILIVDDEWLTRLEIEEMLTNLGYDVAGQAETGAEAVAMARELNPDLVLMDMKMPGEMNGIDAAKEIKAELKIPIVFISGYGDPEYIEAAKEIAPFGYVMKPFDEREVHAFVEIALSRRKFELELEKSHERLEQNNLVLQKEIAARKRTENTLQESEIKFRTVFEQAGDAIWIVDLDTYSLLDFNNLAHESLGYTRDEFKNLKVADIEATETPEVVKKHIDHIAQKGLGYFESQHKTKEGKIKDVSLTGRIITLGGKKFGVSISHDLTFRKQMEEKLRESEKKLYTLLNATTDEASLAETDGTFTACNDALAKSLGKKKEELIGKPMMEFFSAEAAERRKTLLQSFVTSKKPLQWEDEHAGRYFDNSVYPILDDNGNVKQIALFARNITEQKKAEETIKEKQQMNDLLLNSMPYPIMLINKARVVMAANKIALDIGVKIGDYCWKGFGKCEYLSDKDQICAGENPSAPGIQCTFCRADEMFKTNGPANDPEVSAFGRLWNTYWIQLNDNQYLHYSIDITDQKQAKEALLESERKYRLTVENIRDGFFTLTGEDLIVTYFNFAAEELLGRKAKDILGKPLLEAFPEAKDSVFEKKYRQAYQTKRFVSFETYFGVKPYENWYDVRVYPGDQSISIFFQITTERKRGEVALQESEEKYRSLITNIPDVTWTTDSEGNTIFCSPNVEDVFAYTQDEIYEGGNNVLPERIHPEDAGRVKESFEKLFEYGTMFDVEYRIKRKDGEWIWAHDRSIAVYERDGVKYADGIFSNITSRKQAEQQKELKTRILDTINRAVNWIESIEDILNDIKEFSGFEAVAIRLREGEYFPYYVTQGFPAHFVEAERYLCSRDGKGEITRDSEGNPYVECMCGNVICGRTNQEKDFFTEGGSFWSNNTSKLLSETTDEDRQTTTRNRCNSEGYESVALIPLKAGNEIIGLIQLSDTRTHRFTDDTILFFEDMGISIGTAFSRKMGEEALRNEKLLSEEYINSLPGLFYVFDEKRFARWNSEWNRITGYSDEELSGMYGTDFFEGEDRTLISNRMLRVFREGVGEAEAKLVAKDGRRISYYFTGLRKKLRGKEHLIGLGIDISKQKLMQEELLKAKKLESLGVLAGGIAHDFNNLMSAVVGNISLARTEMRPGSKGFKNLVEAEKASIQTKALTSRLITFSKGGRPVREAVSIGDLVKNSVDSSLKGSDIGCIFSVPDDILQVEVDEEQMKQVIHNITTNAQEAMAEQGTINVSCGNIIIGEKDTLNLKDGKYVKISVEDQGAGIPEEDLINIFDPYFSTKEMGTQKGMGLGLAVSDSIVKQHDGVITVESKLGTGTTFSIYLPASEKEIVGETPVKKPAPEISATQGEKILVMDDEAVVRDVSNALLTHLGYEVEVAVDGVEAIELYKKAMASEKLFDTVILDLTNKVGMGGAETMVNLLEIDPDVKAIVATGYSNDPIMSNFREHGFRGALPKPFTLDQLKTALQDAFAGE